MIHTVLFWFLLVLFAAPGAIVLWFEIKPHACIGLYMARRKLRKSSWPRPLRR